jgi:putative hydrolase of the HAD superfamily
MPHPAVSRPDELEVVLLDADGVVQKTGPGWRSSVAALCADPDRAEAFLADVFAAEKPCLTGDGDFRCALDGVLRRWNSEVRLEEALRVWTLIDPDEAVLGVVRRLRARGVRVALATNQQAHRAAFMSEELGYADCFDRLFYSCELGHAKPALGYFRAVLDGLDVTPGRALFVDDHAANVEAARAAGLAAAIFHVDDGIATLERLLREHGLRVD